MARETRRSRKSIFKMKTPGGLIYDYSTTGGWTTRREKVARGDIVRTRGVQNIITSHCTQRARYNNILGLGLHCCSYTYLIFVYATTYIPAYNIMDV